VSGALGAVRRSSGLQFGVVLLGLAILGGIVYLPQAVHGGFLSDAWSNRALYEFAPVHGFFNKISYLGEQSNISPRPLQAVYLVLLNSIFGSHVHYWLTWDVATNIGMCAAFYLLLRKLGFRWLDAGVMAALVLVFPAATSIRFWLATIWGPASIAFVCLGFLLALEAFEAKSLRNKLLLHAASILLFVLSLLLYEIALLVILAGILIYLLRAPWREALARWIADCFVLGVIALTVTLKSSEGHAETEMGAFNHGKLILEQAKTLAMTIVLPFNSDQWYLILLVLTVPAVAGLVWWLRDKADPMRAELQRWLVTMGAGAIVVVLGYVIYAPGTDYYEPLNPGIADRVNLVPSFGWILMLYAGAMLLATLILRDVPRARRWISLAATLGVALLAAGWLRTIGDYSAAFTTAYQEDVRILTTMQTSIPDPKPGSTIWTFAQPVEQVTGVPIFGNTWDMTSSVKLQYDDPSLVSLVAYPESEFECSAAGVNPKGRYLIEGVTPPEYISKYGKTYFIDTTSGESTLIGNRGQCEAALASGKYPLAPYLPPAAP
jgi:ABC-type multidrug transport system fused ATPase/permease subunit